MKRALPPPTKAQGDMMARLTDEIGCAVCLFCYRIEGSQGEIHHLKNGARDISHSHVIPLCLTHHRQGTTQHPSRHSANGCHGGRAIFESTYMTEQELLRTCEQWMNVEYSEQ